MLNNHYKVHVFQWFSNNKLGMISSFQKLERDIACLDTSFWYFKSLLSTLTNKHGNVLGLVSVYILVTQKPLRY